GVALPSRLKQGLNANQFFPVSQAFDVLAANALNPDPAYEEALQSNLSYVGGANPVNQPFVTGVGWRRQRSVVSQFAENDRAVLPPVGLPLGALQSGPDFIPRDIYRASDGGNLLQRLIYPKGDPTTGAGTVFAFYDRWSDQYSLRQEFVIPKMARGAVATLFLFAAGEDPDQPWGREEIDSAGLKIHGLPEVVDREVTVSLSSTIDLSRARITWDGEGLEPRHGPEFTFTPRLAGPDRALWADVLFPDGRRLYARASYRARPPAGREMEDFQRVPVACNSNLIAWYPLDGDLKNAVGQPAGTLAENRHPGDLVLSEEGNLDDSSFIWGRRSHGQALRVNATSTSPVASVAVPPEAFDLAGGEASINSRGICLEGMFYIEELVPAGSLLRLDGGFSRNLEWQYLGLREGTTTKFVSTAPSPFDRWLGANELGEVIELNRWNHVRLELTRTATNVGEFRVYVNGSVVRDSVRGEARGDQLPDEGDRIFEPADWNGSGPITLTFGNFKGWVDEVMVSSLSEPIEYSPPTLALNPSSTGDRFPAGRVPIYVDPGVTAFDRFGKALDAAVSGMVDAAVPGIYILTYSVIDDCGQEVRAERVVTVEAVSAPPEVILNGPAALSLWVGQPYAEFGATAVDFEGQPLSVTRMGDIDVSTSGSTTLTYRSEPDSAGRRGMETRTISVMELNLGNLKTHGLALNLDGDRLSDFLEYALGLDPGTGLEKRPPLAIIVGEEGHRGVRFVRPAASGGELSYQLEGAFDLGNPTQWSAIDPGAEEISTCMETLEDGLIEVTMAGLENHLVFSREKGFVRLRVALSDGSLSDLTPVHGWLEQKLPPGHQTFADPFLPESMFSGVVDAGSDGPSVDVAASAGSGSVRSALPIGRQAYLEVVEPGHPLEGHRFDLEEASTDADTLVIDEGSPENTLTDLPDLRDLRIVVRLYPTLDEWLPPQELDSRNGGSMGPGISDEVLLFENGRYVSFWPFDHDDGVSWVASEDSFFSNAGVRPVDPVGGAFVNLRQQAKSLTRFGRVRDVRLVEILGPGYHLLGNPFPRVLSPAALQLLRTNGFTGHSGPGAADLLQIWTPVGGFTG
ncbi:MAG: immunoglobulin-like domain-containing protein, partial [Verrucomicrobiota bacterium]